MLTGIINSKIMNHGFRRAVLKVDLEFRFWKFRVAGGEKGRGEDVKFRDFLL